MTDKQTPPDWVLLEAAKRSGWNYNLAWLRAGYHSASDSFRALCDMIERYEHPPVDRKLLCAREAWEQLGDVTDEVDSNWVAVRAIEFWEEGFGR